MTDTREFEGIGYHHYDGNDDCLLVEQWIKRPDDLKGQSVPFSKLLPQEMRCANPVNHYNTGSRNNNASRKFRFRIIIEIDKMVV